MANILHVASGGIFAGAEKQMLEILIGLKKNTNHHISVILFHDSLLADKLRDSGIKVFIIAMGFANISFSPRRIRQVIRNNNIDIIHGHGYKANIAVYLSMMFRNRIVCFRTEHGLPEPFRGWKLLKYRLYHAFDMHIARKQCRRTIAVSKDVYDYLSQSIPQSKLVYIPNCIGIPAPADSTKAGILRSEFSLRPEHKILGIIGRLFPVKNHRLFIDLIAAMKRKNTGIRGLVVGDGPLEGELKKYAADKGVSNEIIFCGFRDDMENIYRVVDIVVFTSLHEGLPMTLLESLAAGVPVIAPAVGGLTEVLSKCGRECLVENHDAELLAEKCFDILNNDLLYEDIALKGKRLIENEYSIDTYIEKLSNLYNEALASGSLV